MYLELSVLVLITSVLFAILVMNADLPGSEFIAMVVTCTVGLSFVLPGVTANPMSAWIAGRRDPQADAL